MTTCYDVGYDDLPPMIRSGSNGSVFARGATVNTSITQESSNKWSEITSEWSEKQWLMHITAHSPLSKLELFSKKIQIAWKIDRDQSQPGLLVKCSEDDILIGIWMNRNRIWHRFILTLIVLLKLLNGG